MNRFIIWMIILLAPFLAMAAYQVPTVSEGVRPHAEEKEWVELYCYETRARGSEGVASAEAVAELVPSLIAEAKKLDIEIKVPAPSITAEYFWGMIEAVCAAQTIDEARERAQVIANAGDTFREEMREWGDEVADTFDPIGRKLKEEIELELVDKKAALEAEATLRLRDAATSEQQEREQQLIARLTERARAVVTAGALAGQYGLNLSEDQLVQIGADLAGQWRADEEKNLRDELTQKYKALAEEERMRISDVLAGESLRVKGGSVQNLGKMFQGLPTGIAQWVNEKTATERSRWEKEALLKRAIIVQTIVAKIVDAGEKEIESQRDNLLTIDKAIKNGKITIEGIASAHPDALLLILQKEEAAFLAALQDKATDISVVAAQGASFQKRWDAIRASLYAAKNTLTQAGIYQQITRKLESVGFTRRRIEELTPVSLTYGARWEQEIRGIDPCLALRRGEAPDADAPAQQCDSFFNETIDQINDIAIFEREKMIPALKEYLSLSENSPQEELLNYQIKLSGLRDRYNHKEQAELTRYYRHNYFKYLFGATTHLIIKKKACDNNVKDVWLTAAGFARLKATACQ